MIAICRAAITILFLFIIYPSDAAERVTRIGVLANRGMVAALKEWQPTSEYLNQSLKDDNFEIVPIDFDGLYLAVEKGEIDFVVANAGQYVELEAMYNISRIATLRNLGPGGSYTSFGGVLFTRANRNDINKLKDIKGKKLLRPDETSLGGWLMQWREMAAAGVDITKDLAELRSIGNHDKVVMGVLAGEADIGAVRTDVLERLAEKKKIDLKEIKIINPQKSADFPFLHSTRLYPEWPFAKLKHTNDQLAQRVAIALLSMSANNPAAKAINSAGWTVPYDYGAVHDLYRELRIGPYQNVGKFNLIDVLKKYWLELALMVILLCLLAGFSVVVVRSNRKLALSEAQIRDKSLALEEKKAEIEQTLAQLDKTNRMLVESIHYASKIQDALLPDKDALSDAIKDIHVCWKPLHVVGGDYFWLERIGDKCIIVIVDCTGHGVPGAFMTMVAASALDRILHDLKIFDPANILSQLDDMVRTRLKQDKPDSTSDDGLEAAVCVYNIQTKNLAYAGAGLPLISANNGEISEIRGTRTCLGYRSLPMRGPIETHNISVENGMSFYMLTDGVPDHMGGKPRRLLGRKHLHGIILKNHTLPMEEQMMKIQHALKEYSGSEPRRDDMTLIGFTPG